MVQIHIDTDKDSKQTLKKVIQFLQQFIHERPQWQQPEQEPRPAYNPQPYMERREPATPSYDMPVSSPASQPTPTPDAVTQSSSDMFSMFDSGASTSTQPTRIEEDTDDQDDDSAPKLIRY